MIESLLIIKRYINVVFCKNVVRSNHKILFLETHMEQSAALRNITLDINLISFDIKLYSILIFKF
jgi:hypothetical protein